MALRHLLAQFLPHRLDPAPSRLRGRIDVIGPHGFVAAELAPEIADVLPREKIPKDEIMIAHEARGRRQVAGRRDKPVQHAGTVAAAIDIVAEIDEMRLRGGPVAQILPDAAPEQVEKIRAAVNVADRIDAFAIGERNARRGLLRRVAPSPEKPADKGEGRVLLPARAVGIVRSPARSVNAG